LIEPDQGPHVGGRHRAAVGAPRDRLQDLVGAGCLFSGTSRLADKDLAAAGSVAGSSGVVGSRDREVREPGQAKWISGNSRPLDARAIEAQVNVYRNALARLLLPSTATLEPLKSNGLHTQRLSGESHSDRSQSGFDGQAQLERLLVPSKVDPQRVLGIDRK